MPAARSVPRSATAPAVGEAEALRFLAALGDAGDRALAQHDTVTRTYRIGGRPVRLRFAGPALVDRVTPALAHRITDADDATAPALDVTVWDTDSTGVAPPPP